MKFDILLSEGDSPSVELALHAPNLEAVDIKTAKGHPSVQRIAKIRMQNLGKRVAIAFFWRFRVHLPTNRVKFYYLREDCRATVEICSERLSRQFFHGEYRHAKLRKASRDRLLLALQGASTNQSGEILLSTRRLSRDGRDFFRTAVATILVSTAIASLTAARTHIF